MTLQASGAISLGNVNTELGYSSTSNITLNTAVVRSLAGVPSGQISLSNFHGKTKFPAYGTWLTQYCSGYNLYYRYANGSGGYYDQLAQANSATCGYVPPGGNFVLASRTYESVMNGWYDNVDNSWGVVFGGVGGSPYINGAYVDGLFSWSLCGGHIVYLYLRGAGRAKTFFNYISIAGYGTFYAANAVDYYSNGPVTVWSWDYSGPLGVADYTVYWT